MSGIKPDRFSRLIGNLWLAKPTIIQELREKFELPQAQLATLRMKQVVNTPEKQFKANPASPMPAQQLAQQLPTASPRPSATGMITTGTVATGTIAIVSQMTPHSQTVQINKSVVNSIGKLPITMPLKNQPLIDNWEELTAKIKLCEDCQLCSGRKQVVIERGNRNARWMFVGEGPGEQEDLQGLPFVGNSGQLLNKMITAMKLDNENEVYITNVVKCRPPHNRNPEAAEIAACHNYLQSQIKLLKPKIIIALGRYAAQALLNSELAVGKLRGKTHDYQGIPLIVTYHPSYLLRAPSAKKDAWDDLQLAMQVFAAKT